MNELIELLRFDDSDFGIQKINKFVFIPVWARTWNFLRRSITVVCGQSSENVAYTTYSSAAQ